MVRQPEEEAGRQCEVDLIQGGEERLGDSHCHPHLSPCCVESKEEIQSETSGGIELTITRPDI